MTSGPLLPDDPPVLAGSSSSTSKVPPRKARHGLPTRQGDQGFASPRGHPPWSSGSRENRGACRHHAPGGGAVVAAGDAARCRRTASDSPARSALRTPRRAAVRFPIRRGRRMSPARCAARPTRVRLRPIPSRDVRSGSVQPWSRQPPIRPTVRLSLRPRRWSAGTATSIGSPCVGSAANPVTKPTHIEGTAKVAVTRVAPLSRSTPVSAATLIVSRRRSVLHLPSATSSQPLIQPEGAWPPPATAVAAARPSTSGRMLLGTLDRRQERQCQCRSVKRPPWDLGCVASGTLGRRQERQCQCRSVKRRREMSCPYSLRYRRSNRRSRKGTPPQMATILSKSSFVKERCTSGQLRAPSRM